MEESPNTQAHAEKNGRTSAVIFTTGTTAVKMTQNNIQQVQQHTGMKAEDLSEEQLDAAMNDLGIEGQEPTDQEIASLEVEEEKHPSV